MDDRKPALEIDQATLDAASMQLGLRLVVLFGSHAAGSPPPGTDSDIDLAIFTPNVDGLNLVQRVHLTSELAVGCDSRVELHLYPSAALANARPTIFAGYIIAHGKRLI